MIAPALFIISKDLGITSDEEKQLSLSSFVLAFAVAPLVLGSLSEIYGRKWILQSSNLWFLLWNILCGFLGPRARSSLDGFCLVVVQARFMAWVFNHNYVRTSPNLRQVAGGVVGDCWRPEERGKSLGLYSFIPLLGPAIGPIIGGYIAERATWRWIFWSTSLFDGALQIVAFFFFWETHGPTILHKKAKKMRNNTANPDLHTKFEQPDRTPSQILRTGLTRAFMLLATHSIIQIIALYLAYNFGTIYIVLGTFLSLWTERYHQSVATSGLNFISLIVGLTIGSQGGAWFTDRLWRYFEKRGAVAPENRVLLMLPGAFFVPIGLCCYGWSAQVHTHWIVPNLGIAIFGTGTQLGVQCLQAYIVDTYGQFTASALVTVSALRSLTGFGFPLFAPKLYQSLDYGWGNSLLALISIAFGFPAPPLIWKYGAALRARVKSSDLG